MGRDKLQLVGELLVGLPQIVALLHPQPQARAVAAELAETEGHLRGDAVGPFEDPVQRLAADPQLARRCDGPWCITFEWSQGRRPA